MLSKVAAVLLTRRFQRTLARISTRAGALTAAEWAALGSWDEGDIVRFIERTDPVFAAAKSAAVNTAAGYYAVLAELPIPGLRPQDIDVLADHRAPFLQHWHALSEHRPWDEAFEAGQIRADALASDLVTSASRRTGDAVLGQRVVGWRRVLTGSSCKWCSTIATQRYRTAESADFGHDRCDCSVAPILGEFDPGQVINAEQIGTINATLPVRV